MTLGTFNSNVKKTNGVSLGTAFNQEDAEAQRSTQAKDDKQAEGLKNKRGLDIQKLQYTKLGNTVNYSKGSGTIVAKDGMYVTVFNEAADAYDKVHVGETYLPGDSISMGVMNKLWDQMAQETRSSLLRKAKIADPQHFISRTWLEIPQSLKDVIQKKDYAMGPDPSNRLGAKPMSSDNKPQGKGKDPTINIEPEDDLFGERSHPYNKSDVEHGALGGVVTDTPFDAPADYEECSREGNRAQNQHNHQQKEPKNLKEDAKEIKIGFVSGETVKGNPDEVEKEGGGSGASISTGTAGVNNAVYNEKKIRNKYNTRWGPRSVTAEEAEEITKYINK
jgi:hypothetical protein